MRLKTHFRGLFNKGNKELAFLWKLYKNDYSLNGVAINAEKFKNRCNGTLSLPLLLPQDQLRESESVMLLKSKLQGDWLYNFF